jgi:hypothetical protein
MKLDGAVTLSGSPELLIYKARLKRITDTFSDLCGEFPDLSQIQEIF